MTKFEKRERVLFFSGSDIFRAVVTDIEHEPFYTIHLISPEEKMIAAAECNMFKDTLYGLKAARAEVNRRIDILQELIDKIDNEIERIEGDNASI